MKRPILLDCDPGTDDALAILVACGSPNLALMAVTTGSGRLSHGRTARNAAITLAAAKANHVPVTRGPHWAAPAFVEWEDHPCHWRQMAAWAAGRT